MAEEYVVQMKGITKVYPNGIAANQDVDLNVRKGEIHALMGENGAGKSTLMKMLFGLEQPTSGEIWVNGEKVNLSSPSVAISKGIGMVHQHFMLVPSLTVAENMVLGMSIKGWIEMARFIRNQILIIRDRDYNVASRCIGTPTVRIVLRNLLPYLVSVIMLRMALTIPEAIGNEVFITYIGLGLSVETPSLGNLVNDGRKVMMQAGLRYQLLYPTLILSFVTIAFYLIGNAFSDAADPKNHLQ